MSFIHCHLHSSASTLDGCGHIEEYAELAKMYKMSSICITDHGNMSNVYNFYKTLKKYDIKAIIGCEFYLYNDFIFNDSFELKVPTSHQIVLVKNKQGYVNINKLNYDSFTKTYYRKPLIRRSELYKNKEGLIITSSCAISEINQLFAKNKDEDAIKILNQCKEVFNDDFYIEIQLNELESQKLLNKKLIKWAKESDTKIIITGDVHYSKKGDDRIQDLVVAIKRNTDPDDEKSWKLNARNLYFQNRDDFHVFNTQFGFNYDEKFIDECLDNTLEINSKCDYELETGKNNFPVYSTNTEEKQEDFLLRIVKERFKKKLEQGKIDNKNKETYLKRIKYEYDVLTSKDYVGYILIIWDVIDYAKRNNIIVGACRGSVGGSLICYLIGITNIDPIINDLYFERFLNPEKVTNPDIDFDIESERREELEKYLVEKYGKEHVTKVVTFGTYQIKGVLRDLTRVLSRPKSDVDFVCKQIPDFNPDIKKWKVADILNFTIETIKNKQYELSRLSKWLDENKDIVYYADRLLNNIRHFGTHAGGIVITPKPVWNYMPVNRIHGEIVSGFEESWTNKALSDLGILKIDALGLSTLTLFKYTMNLVRETQGIDLTEKIDNIDVNDKELIDDFAKAENAGVFQFESPGVSKLIQKVKPDCFEDIVAINALNRPATLSNGMAYRYAEWKNDPRKIELPHPILKEYLKNTHGILVYQETLIYILSKLTGYTYAEADIGRKLLDRGKAQEKYYSYIKKLKEDIKKKNDFDDDTINEIVKWLESYSGYSFNRSHSSGYAYSAMQTLFLKNKFPLEYYTSLLTLSGQDDVPYYMKTIQKCGINILPVDINKSDFNFKLEDGKIRTGLKIIKSFGDKAWAEIKNNRPFNTMEDFFNSKIKWGKVNKRVVEVLIKTGALDSLEENRNLLLYWLLESGKKVDRLINIPAPNDAEKEKWFYEITGISSFMGNELEQYGFKKASEWESKNDLVYGKVIDVLQKTTKTNKPFYVVRLDDGVGTMSFIVWDGQWKPGVFSKGNVVLAQLDKNEYGFSLVGDAFTYSK